MDFTEITLGVPPLRRARREADSRTVIQPSRAQRKVLDASPPPQESIYSYAIYKGAIPRLARRVDTSANAIRFATFYRWPISCLSRQESRERSANAK